MLMFDQARFEAAPFADECAHAPSAILDRLLSISKTVRALTAFELSAIGLDVGQDQFVHAVGTSSVLSTSEAARRLNIRPSTVSKMGDRLLAKGLIERLGDEQDFRRTLLRLTPAGAEKRRQVHATWERIEAQLEKCEPAIREEAVDAALDVLEKALTKQLLRIR